MTKTLYSRVVLAFIGIILISLICSLTIGITFFKQRINAAGQVDMLNAAEEIGELYEQSQPADTKQFLQQMAQLSTYPIHLYDQSQQVTFFSLNNNNVATISEKGIEEVLSGKVYRSLNRQEETYIGVPMTFNGQLYGMFLQYSYQNEGIINQLLLFVLISALLIGSLCILVAARYLVTPLRKLKDATEKLAGGDFNVSLDLKRQDEVGELAQSFNQMTKELKQIEQMRQDFVSNVSHEIQSPLTSISGFAKALKNSELITDEQRPYYLDIIISESDRLSRLGDNLLKLASLDSEHHPFTVESIDVAEQIRQVIVASEPQWSTKKLMVSLKAPSPIWLSGDRDLLQQVWLNLLSNSIKFTPNSGTIMIDLKQENNLVITFADTGKGIPAEELSHLFQRFYKVDKARSRQQGGNGLGLAIVKKIITLHHGTIDITSIVARGTLITITLPLHQTTPPSS